MDLTLLDEVRTTCGPDFVVLSGHDQILLPALVTGAAGAIGSFFGAIPNPFVAIYRQFQAGAVSAAARTQSEANRIIRSVKQYRSVPALKTLLTLQGIDGGAYRAPTLPLTPEEQSSMCRDLEALGFNLTASAEAPAPRSGER
jgi:N-acetylneuraminate lyase